MDCCLQHRVDQAPYTQGLAVSPLSECMSTYFEICCLATPVCIELSMDLHVMARRYHPISPYVLVINCQLIPLLDWTRTNGCRRYPTNTSSCDVVNFNIRTYTHRAAGTTNYPTNTCSCDVVNS